jgi:hypothetical protein
MMSSFLFELFLLAFRFFLILILHISALVILVQLFLKLRVEFCDVEAFVAVDVAVHLSLVEGLVQGQLFLGFLFRFHIFLVTLDYS